MAATQVLAHSSLESLLVPAGLLRWSLKALGQYLRMSGNDGFCAYDHPAIGRVQEKFNELKSCEVHYSYKYFLQLLQQLWNHHSVIVLMCLTANNQ